jgi:hypothetical protein
MARVIIPNLATVPIQVQLQQQGAETIIRTAMITMVDKAMKIEGKEKISISKARRDIIEARETITTAGETDKVISTVDLNNLTLIKVVRVLAEASGTPDLSQTRVCQFMKSSLARVRALSATACKVAWAQKMTKTQTESNMRPAQGESARTKTKPARPINLR